jgi:thiamine-phosphate pyrophosphorylase
MRAQKEGADYVNIGPIFPTSTKEGVSNFLGPEAIANIRSALTIPFTVMGGITASNLDLVLHRGARRIAVVTAITLAPDMAATVRILRERIAEFSGVS